MSARPRIARVAVPAPVRKLFDYLIPADLPPPQRGARVRVPFGRRRSAVGVVMSSAKGSEVPLDRLKAITRALDAEPLLPEPLLKLLEWTAEYYHYPLGEVIAAALPAHLRVREATASIGAKVRKLTAAGACASAEAVERAPVQQRFLRAFQAAPEGLDAAALAAVSARWRPAVAALVTRGWVSVHQHDFPPPPAGELRRPPPLSPGQKTAADAIAAASGFTPFLLYGVTGSGKTEVYLRVIEAVLARGEQALVLVPEIGLTPQWVARFRERVRAPAVVLHSALGERERAHAWLAARAGKAQLVIGTRSAVFAPLPRLRFIIVDEEHDPSYKQQDGLRYSARDVAVLRASREGVPIVLGSATPSLETLNRARSGAYQWLALPERAGGAALPPVQLLDMRRVAVDEGLSHPLRMALAETLQRGEQALLFLNRRGFAPIWMCFDCGWIAPCERCDARLTYHRRSKRLRCHHCGAERAQPAACPACGGASLHALGEGTERVEAALARMFPRARVIRIDRDSTRAKGALEAKLERVHTGDADILIGTQMLSKGHDFPNVTLVGVLDADQGLYGTDFRAGERLVQQVIQVSGRAGRATKPGRVLIQTYHPAHPIFGALSRHRYDDFAEYALAERRETGYPPFGYLALLRAESPKPDAGLAFLRAARALARCYPPGPTVQVMEPVPSPMERRAGRYRAQLLVQSARRGPLHAFLGRWLERLDELKEGRRVRWSLDVDPADLY